MISTHKCYYFAIKIDYFTKMSTKLWVKLSVGDRSRYSICSDSDFVKAFLHNACCLMPSGTVKPVLDVKYKFHVWWRFHVYGIMQDTFSLGDAYLLIYSTHLPTNRKSALKIPQYGEKDVPDTISLIQCWSLQ